MSDRRRLLVFSIIVLTTVALSGVGITAYHFSVYSVELRSAGTSEDLLSAAGVDQLLLLRRPLNQRRQ